MEIRSLKLRSRNLLLGKIKVFVIALFCLCITELHSQSYQDLGNGKYQFESPFPDWDLHFWLFADGYHSFEHSPLHYYGTNNLPAIPELYHAIPYNDDDDDVTDIPIGLITNGSSFPVLDIIEFQNQVEIKRSWSLVNSEDNFFILMFENSMHADTVSGCVEFHYNENFTSITSSNILDNYNNDWVGQGALHNSEYDGYTHKYIWPFHGLKPGEQRFVYIPADCLASSMTSVYTRGVLKINDCNATFEDDSKNDGSNSEIFNSPIYTLRSVVSNYPHDPNYIKSNPNCWTSKLALTQTIRYRLQFQNKGADLSKDVLVNFLSNAAFESVELINSSDDCSLYWDNNDINVIFNSIYIRGINELPAPNYNSTIGWIEIDVCYKVENIESLDIDCIEFEAHVLFDGQHPIIASNRICNELHCQTEENNENNIGICIPSPQYQGINHGGNGNKTSTIPEDKSEFEFNLYPNPVEQFINIDGDNLDNISRVYITNTLGEIIIDDKSFKYIEKNIDISSLKAGLYFINVIIDGETQSKSIIKI